MTSASKTSATRCVAAPWQAEGLDAHSADRRGRIVTRFVKSLVQSWSRQDTPLRSVVLRKYV